NLSLPHSCFSMRRNTGRQGSDREQSHCGGGAGDRVRRVLRSRFPVSLTLILALGLSAGLTGPSYGFDLRSLWPFGRDKAAEEPIPDPVAYTATFEVTGDADRKLTKALRNASNLISLDDTPPSGLVGLIARARQDLTTLTAVLYESARYAGQIDITIAGRPLAEVSPFDPITQPVPVAVHIAPGPAFTLGRVAATPMPPETTLADLRLQPGEPA